MKFDIHRIAKIAGPWDQEGWFSKKDVGPGGERIPAGQPAGPSLLHPFTEDDWMAFSGADRDKNPHIAELDEVNGKFGAVIWADTEVEVTVDSITGSGTIEAWHGDFDDADKARAVAEQIARMSGADINDAFARKLGLDRIN